MLENAQENAGYCCHYNLLLWVHGGWERRFRDNVRRKKWDTFPKSCKLLCSDNSVGI